MGGTRGEAEEKACLFLLVTIGRHRGRCGVPLDPVSLVLHFLCVFAATCPWVPSLVLGQGEPPEPGGSDVCSYDLLLFGLQPQGPCRVGTGESGLVLSEEGNSACLSNCSGPKRGV